MTDIETLNKAWMLSAIDPEPGTPAALLPPRIPAAVPGTVHTDLLAAGLIEDPYLDLNELNDSWIGRTQWVYRSTLDWHGSEHDRTDLVFDGLDTVAIVTLNGQEVGRTFNQHRTYRFDVTELLRVGQNDLDVSFESAWAYAEHMQNEIGDLPNAYPTPFNFIRKMAANFGWDWGPQLVTAGIWKDVRLESWSGARLAEVSTSVTLDGDEGVVTVSARLEYATPRADGRGADGAGQRQSERRLVVRLGTTVSETAVAVDPQHDLVRAELRAPGVAVWWPRGMGEQPLYELRISVTEPAAGPSVSQAETDAWQRRVGFRTVVLDTAGDAEGSAFTFVINGTPTFIRGANWIPDDCFPSRITAQRYRERIEQAAEANLNLLRVWGGGIYERDEFYDICDELGMLTWQDFLFACAAYPEEAPFAAEVEAEARDNVLRLSSHASLVLFNGCNENIWGWFDWDWQSAVGERTWGLGYYTELLPAIVSELAPMVPYWPGSPFSGSIDVHANDVARGNIHVWDVWNTVDYSAYAAYSPRFVSEFGFQGPPTWSTLIESIHDDPLASDSPGMLLHQKADDGNGKLERGMSPHLPSPQSVEEWHYLMQLNQSRAVVFGIEHFRALRPQCMGTIVWQLNDCWPVTSWSAIDGFGRRKPLWHGLRRANAPQLCTVQRGADGELSLVAINDGADEWMLQGTVALCGFDGVERAAQIVAERVAPFSQLSVPLVEAVAAPTEPLSQFIVTRFGAGRPAVHVFAEDKDLALDDVPIDIVVGEFEDGSQSIELSSPLFARGVTIFADRLQADAWVDDTDLDLVPGQTTTVTLFSPRPIGADELGAPGVVRSLNELVSRVVSDRLRVRTAQR